MDAQPQARTRRARAAVIDAAAAEFLDKGYANATLAAISARAEVPPATVYRLFSSKVGILKAVLDVAIAGDDEDVAIADRAPARSALSAVDPVARVAGYVGVAVSINERSAAIYRILVGAAAADAEAAELLDRLHEQRRRGQSGLLRSLAADHALRSGVSRREAADIVHAFMSPEMFRLLVIDRGWSANRYAVWLTTVLVAQLL